MHVVTSMPRVVVHIVTCVLMTHCKMVMLSTGLTAVVTELRLTLLVMLLITLAFVRRAVTLSARVVIAGAHWGYPLMCTVVLLVMLVVHLVPLLLISS